MAFKNDDAVDQPATPAEQAAAHLAALERERHGYELRGKDDRVAEVDIEIERVKKALEPAPAVDEAGFDPSTAEGIARGSKAEILDWAAEQGLELEVTSKSKKDEIVAAVLDAIAAKKAADEDAAKQTATVDNQDAQQATT